MATSGVEGSAPGTLLTTQLAVCSTAQMMTQFEGSPPGAIAALEGGVALQQQAKGGVALQQQLNAQKAQETMVENQRGFQDDKLETEEKFRKEEEQDDREDESMQIQEAVEDIIEESAAKNAASQNRMRG